MLKSISRLQGVKLLKKSKQKQINGGLGRSEDWLCNYYCWEVPSPSPPCICVTHEGP